MRVTRELLRKKVDLLNSMSKNDYVLDIAYGGYRLCKKQGAGYSDVSYRMSAKEIYYVIETLINYLCGESS